MARVVVIGGGIGGLAAAIRLAALGHRVTLLEKEAEPGGKIRVLKAGGVAIDSGPTVFTMRAVFDDLFAAAGTRLEDHLTLTPLQILARHAWAQDARLDLLADRSKSIEAIAAFSGAADAKGFERFCVDAAGIYNTLKRPFLHAYKPNALTLPFRVGNWTAIFALRPFETLWHRLGTYFRDPRLIQLFARYATYNGASPFLAPATLMLIAHVEQEGVWAVGGGMQNLARALAQVAASCGVEIRCDAPVARIELTRGRASGAILRDGERAAADAVIFNGDAAALADGLLGVAARKAVRPSRRDARTLSAVTLSLSARTSGFPLARHNVFFGGDYRTEFGELFAARRLPGDPTVYVCAQNRIGGGPQEDREPLFILANAPAGGDQPPRPQEMELCRTRMIARMAACGLTLSIQEEIRTEPEEFHRLFPATGGALYGRAPHGPFGAFARPGTRTAVPGLYLAGGSAHPGAGVPMAALSGHLAAQAVAADLRSIPASRLAVTSGGISTPSATTGGMPSR